jgi:hypothetical protein
MIERAVTLSQGDVITIEDLPNGFVYNNHMTRRRSPLAISSSFSQDSQISTRSSDVTYCTCSMRPATIANARQKSRHQSQDTLSNGRAISDRVWSSARFRSAFVTDKVSSYTCKLTGIRPGVGQYPIDGRRARGVVRDEDDRPELQLFDDGVDVADLIVGGVRVAGRFIRIAPAEKIKCHDPARWREVAPPKQYSVSATLLRVTKATSAVILKPDIVRNSPRFLCVSEREQNFQD